MNNIISCTGCSKPFVSGNLPRIANCLHTYCEYCLTLLHCTNLTLFSLSYRRGANLTWPCWTKWVSSEPHHIQNHWTSDPRAQHPNAYPYNFCSKFPYDCPSETSTFWGSSCQLMPPSRKRSRSRLHWPRNPYLFELCPLRWAQTPSNQNRW